MPLIRVAEKFESSLRKRLETAQDSLHVVVYSDKGRSVGLVVDRILDIVEEGFVMQRQTGRVGILGSAVIQKRTTDILDVPALVSCCCKDSSNARASVVQRSAIYMASTQQFCTFFLQDQCFGVPVEQVPEVIRYQQMTRVPLGRRWCAVLSTCEARS